MNRAFALILTMFLALPAWAGEADVEAVNASQQSDGRWRFDVTVRHDDQGWDHYANAWQILSPDGAVLGERILAHPHDHEQPFTRSLSGVTIPETIQKVTLRARDSVHDFGGAEIEIELNR